MEKQMGGGKRKMRGKDWAEMYILESGEEGYSAEFIGVWHRVSVHIIALERRSDTILKFLLDDWPGEKLVNTTVFVQKFVTVLD